MSALISSNSVAIDQLKVITSDLGQRMGNLENKVDALVYKVDSIADDQQTMLRLNLVANLILRIKQSIDTGYDTLEDIIHCSLLGQTSPLLLPTDQIKLVQNEVRKV